MRIAVYARQLLLQPTSRLLQIALIAQCTLIRKVNDDVFVIFEHVPISEHMKETVTRVHIVSLEDFDWKDTPDNVVPTCTCPSNRNLKDCCAGIMFALQQRPEFKDWYGTCFTHKKEILSRRLRADCDPVSVHCALSLPFYLTFPYHSLLILQTYNRSHVQP